MFSSQILLKSLFGFLVLIRIAFTMFWCVPSVLSMQNRPVELVVMEVRAAIPADCCENTDRLNP